MPAVASLSRIGLFVASQHGARIVGPALAAIRFLRRSHALASMLPAFLFSGVMTLAITAAAGLDWAGPTREFFPRRVEGWLVAWPIAFPVAYVLGHVLSPLLTRLNAAVNDDASGRIAARHRSTVRRGPKNAA